MPAIRPEAISNCVRLAYKSRALVLRLVTEDGAVDALLPTVVDELAPNEHGIASLGSQYNFFARADELIVVSLTAVCVSISRVVAFIEFCAIKITVFCHPPKRFTHRRLNAQCTVATASSIAAVTRGMLTLPWTA